MDTSKEQNRNDRRGRRPPVSDTQKRRGQNRTKRPPAGLGEKEKGNAGKLEIVPLGGLGEIGKNMTAFSYEDNMMIIDCGMSFPDDEMFGIDVVIPDFKYVVENASRLKGLVVTHGHEDHIGGIPYLLKQVRVPIYGTRLTLGLIENKLREHGIKGDLRRIEAGDKFRMGCFRVETIRATHSVADSLALAVDTPAGRIFHSGDFKLDYTPIDGDPMDFQKLAAIGAKGIDLMMCDSTNSERKGFTKSEKSIGPIFESIFADTNSRIIIATFASNIHRVQTIINTAVKFRRKVALSGRSMLNVMDLATELGYMSIPPGTIVDLADINNIPDKKLVLITTGSQGEPMSALSRMAASEHRNVKIKKGDRVILSSSPIPGNEKTVSSIVNSLLELGAEVIYSDLMDIHVSGHASSEEIKLLISLLKPKNYMPVHGEYRHLYRNSMIAEDLGMHQKNIFIARNGDVLSMKDGYVSKTGRRVPADPVFVDGLGVGDIGAMVLKDRKQLSEAGLIIVAATVDTASGFLISDVDIISRGFTYEKENGDILAEASAIAGKVISDHEKRGFKDLPALRSELKSELRKYISIKTKRNPVILTVIMEA
ncbi:MAG: ribonuclease J [Clostridiales Family XIII bacterium]|jgi:ribonuclease J|nr:ribonuclease J [Clostridiales Family XIII bacterium]